MRLSTQFHAKFRIAEFSDLKLRRESNGDVSFETAVLRRIDPEQILAGEEAVSRLIVAWYGAHIKGGGAPDPTGEDLIAEAMIEGARGSHQPGTA